MQYIFFLGLLLVWVVAWFAYIQPKLAAYHATAGIVAQLDAKEHSFYAWFRLKLHGLWAVVMLFVTSLLTGGAQLVEQLVGLDPTALAPFQDSALWRALVGDEVALKAAAAAAFASALLVLHGKLKDDQTVPQALPIIVPPQGTVVPGGPVSPQ